ncbi:MAG: hypothetical protein KGM47_06300 [Acidobacteriota bacterium]|nr:hypothetical protein [Acidobacteriota bacterium]
MKNKPLVLILCAGALLLTARAALYSVEETDKRITEAREARNRADVEQLRTIVQAASSEARHLGTAVSYERLALLENYLCEAGDVHSNKAVVKLAASDGVSAARKAVELDSGSSQAHSLLGSLLGQLIPYVTMGGMRYGPEATRELDKGIQLDPKNPYAYMDRAIAYFLAPSMFGGSKQSAVQLLHKAASMAPGTDCAASSYIWLAQVDLALGKKGEARRDIQVALKIEPGRAFAQQVAKQVERRRAQ